MYTTLTLSFVSSDLSFFIPPKASSTLHTNSALTFTHSSYHTTTLTIRSCPASMITSCSMCPAGTVSFDVKISMVYFSLHYEHHLGNILP